MLAALGSTYPGVEDRLLQLRTLQGRGPDDYPLSSWTDFKDFFGRHYIAWQDAGWLDPFGLDNDDPFGESTFDPSKSLGSDSPCPCQCPPSNDPITPTKNGPTCGCPIRGKHDPNNIFGPSGFGEQDFISLGQILPYTILFENDPTENAPAQQVIITQQIDPNLDWGSFRLGTFGFGGMTFQVPTNSAYYQTTIDLTQQFGYKVEVTATIDERTGIATWIFTTIDPATGAIPLDPTIGFLPPDTANGVGEGFVSYTIMAGSADPTGTVINAQATVTFDTEPPLDTPLIFNTVDAGTGLTSSVAALPSFERSTSFNVSWSGVDTSLGSAISSYTIYVSEDGGPFTTWLTNTTLIAAPFTGEDGHTYSFYSVAADNAGNMQSVPTSPQASTTVDETTPTSKVAALPAFSPATFTLDWSGSNANGLSIASYDIYVSDNGGAFSPLLTNTTTTSTTFTGANGHTYRFYSVATDSVGKHQPTPTAAQATTSVDTSPPTSAINALPAFSLPSFTLNWSGSDNIGGSGLAGYDVYVSDNGSAFAPLLTDTTLTSTTFTGVDGHTYSFESIVTDNVGNQQALPSTAQAATTVDATPPTSTVSTLPAASVNGFLVSWTGHDGNGSGVAFFNVYVSDNGGPFAPFVLDTSTTSAIFDGSVGHTYGFYSVATDNVGNVEPTPSTAEATTTVVNPLAVTAVAAPSPNPRNTAVSAVDVTFNTPINLASFTMAALTLGDNGGPNLITSAVTISPVAGTTSTYQINGLAGLTAANGNFVLTVLATAVKDACGNFGTGSLSTTWLMDTAPPTSKVSALPKSESSLVFPVSVTGSDAGSPPSGVAFFDVYSKANTGAWTFWTTMPAASTTANFTGQSNKTYSFYSVAYDAAGNAENKQAVIEASTYVPNLTPPVTAVNGTSGTNPTTINTTTGTFTLNMTGNDPGGGIVTYFEVFASVDGGAYQEVGGTAIPAGPADSSGNVHATILYQGDTDGSAHKYAFYSIGVDSAGHVQPAPAQPNLSLSETFARPTPAQLQVTGLVVEHGAVERSYVRYLDVAFNESDSQSGSELTQIVNSVGTSSPDIKLFKYDLNGTNSGNHSSTYAVSLQGATVAVVDHAIEIDFGVNGIGGAPTRRPRMVIMSSISSCPVARRPSITSTGCLATSRATASLITMTSTRSPPRLLFPARRGWRRSTPTSTAMGRLLLLITLWPRDRKTASSPLALVSVKR